MTNSKQDKQFNETLKRMMDSKPKPHEEMKKGKLRPAKKLSPPKDGAETQRD